MIASLTNFPETADIETASDDYAQRFSGGVGAWFLGVQEKVTLRMLAPYPATRILDVGGGHGQLTEALVRSNYRVTVLGSADICRRRIQYLIDDNRCSFKTGNIIDLPYPDQSFDVVVSYRLLPHVTRWQQFLSELTRVARKTVIVDYPEVRSLNYIAPYLFRFKKRLEGNTRPFTCFKQSELLAVFASSGFSFSERYSQFLFPMVLHRKLNSVKLSSSIELVCRLLGGTDLFGSPVILKVIREKG